LFAGLAAAANLTIPVASGSLTLDGKLDEPLWRDARSFSLGSPNYGPAFPAGGEARIAVCGTYLCLAARLPESDRTVAISRGRAPSWLREDQVVWTFAVNMNQRNRVLSLTVNPLGAYSFDSTVPDAGVADGVVATALTATGEWSMEAAIPLSKLSRIGFLSVDRVRVARPDAPELRWTWPGLNERMDFELTATVPETGAEPEVRAVEAVARPRPVRPLTGVAAELAKHSGRIWSDEERAKIDTAFQLSVRKRMTEAALAERAAWQKVGSRADWEKFRDQRIGALRKSLGSFPERTPLRAAVTKRADYGQGFVIENVVYESRPGRLVPANLYLPSKVEGRIPAIVVVHSHHAPKTQAELQAMGMTWARAGVAVLVPDQPGAGERIESQPWPRESYYSRYAMGMQLYLAGESLMKWMVWDLMRGIDMLLERPYIDPARIILLGAVAGGGDPAAVTAALDPRIAASIPFNFGEAGPEEHYTRGPRPYDFDTADPGWGSWESTRNLNRSAADQFFPWLICASVAPRPYMFSFEVGWPKTVEEEPAWARYKKVFELYGERDKLAAVDGFGPFPGPGECTNVGVFLRKRIYPVLKRWLDVPIPASEYRDVRPDSELMCITPEIAAERKPQTTAAQAAAIARTRLERARMNQQALRSQLTVKLGDIEPNRTPDVRTGPTASVAGFSQEAISLTIEPGITLPLIVLKPAAASARAPAVLAFAQQGKSGYLANRAPEIVKLLEQGVTICLADVRGTGEASRTAAHDPRAMGLAGTELMLANTMLGARLKDARSIFVYLSRRADIDPRRIVLWGDSFGPVNSPEMLEKSLLQPAGPDIPQAEPLGSLLALLTALYEPDVAAVATRGGLASWMSVLEDRFTYVPLDVIVPGMLEAGDLPDIAAAIAPRPVLIQAAVDGRNRALALPELKAKAAPRASNTMVRDEPDPAILAEWIAEHLR
jgi:dienelactone hydrolase